MNKDKIYLLLLSITTILFFSLSAVCNQCTSMVLGIKELEEKTTEEAKEKIETDNYFW